MSKLTPRLLTLWLTVSSERLRAWGNMDTYSCVSVNLASGADPSAMKGDLGITGPLLKPLFGDEKCVQKTGWF